MEHRSLGRTGLSISILSYRSSRGYPEERPAVQFALRNSSIYTTLLGGASPDRTGDRIRCASEVLALLQPIHNRTWIQGRTENN